MELNDNTRIQIINEATAINAHLVQMYGDPKIVLAILKVAMAAYLAAIYKNPTKKDLNKLAKMIGNGVVQEFENIQTALDMFDEDDPAIA